MPVNFFFLNILFKVYICNILVAEGLFFSCINNRLHYIHYITTLTDLYCTVLHCVVMNYTVLFCIVLYCTLLYHGWHRTWITWKNVNVLRMSIAKENLEVREKC